MENDKALSLKEAAEILGISYSSIFSKRKKLGFQLPDSRVWRIWRSSLYALDKNDSNMIPLSLWGVKEKKTCQFSSTPSQASTTLTSLRQMGKELDALLDQKTK
jgi:hypothetical protein